MNAVLSTERIALRALEEASREHTTQAVRLLAKCYGFDADEALGKVGLAPVETHVEKEKRLFGSDSDSDFGPDEGAFVVDAAPSKPSRDDVVARLLAGEDPVPVASSDEDTSSDTKRAPKPRLTATQKANKKEEARQKKEVAKKAKEAEKAAAKILKAALKALKAFDKDAAKAVKEAAKVHKVQLKAANLDAVKTTKAALKAIKAFVKNAEKAARTKPKKQVARKSPKKQPEEEHRTIDIAKPEEAKELEEEVLQVKNHVVNGVTYLKAEDNELFDPESTDSVGFWCERTGTIVQEPEEWN